MIAIATRCGCLRREGFGSARLLDRFSNFVRGDWFERLIIFTPDDSAVFIKFFGRWTLPLLQDAIGITAAESRRRQHRQKAFSDW